MDSQKALPELRHQELLERYIAFLLLSRTPSTAELHREKLAPLLREWNDVAPEQWTRSMFTLWLSKRLTGTKPWKPRTTQMMLTSVGMFGDFCRSEGLAVANLIDGIRRPSVHRKRPEFYTLEEAQKIIDGCRGYWMELVVGLAIYAGLRRGEIGNAQWTDISWKERTLLVRGTKVHKDRVLPLCDPLIAILERHRKDSGALVDPSKLQYSLYFALRRAAARAQVPYRSPHKGRAGFLTHLLAKGVDLATCRDLAGHGSVQTTNIYLATTPSRMRAAVDILGA